MGGLGNSITAHAHRLRAVLEAELHALLSVIVHDTIENDKKES